MKNSPAQFGGCLKFIALFAIAVSSFAFAQNAYYRMVRTLEIHEPGIASISGLAFSPQANTFLIVSAPGVSDVILLTTLNELAGSITLATSIPDPVNMAFDDKANSLLFFDADANELVEVKMETDGRQRFSPQTIARFRIPQLDLKNTKGMAFNPDTGELFILDAQGPRIIRILPDFQDRYDSSLAERDGRISIIELNFLQGAELRGIAFNPGDGHLYIMAPAVQKLYELTQQGDVVSTRDLSSLSLTDTRGMVFAPSGDRTDDPATQNLYIVDRGLNSGQGDIVELSLVKPKQIDLSALTEAAVLVQTILTSGWSPPSPDPSGVAYIPSSNHLFVSDGEVDEMAIYAGVNLWEVTLTGGQVQEYTTTAFSDEPAGAAYNPGNQHLYFTDDTGIRRVYELDPGPDGLYFTPDDITTSFATAPFGSLDPEGISFDTWQGHLFIVDGLNAEVYEVDPGPNGVFDGVPPAGDDVVANFDASTLGIHDPEGVEFNPDNGNLYILGSSDDYIVETTRSGTAVQVIDITSLNATKPAGLAYAPSSTDPLQKSLYIVDRGVDNNSDPNENDGKLYEISLGSFTPNLLIDDDMALEGNIGTVNAIFTVWLTSASQDIVTVEYHTTDGSATTADNDYVAATGQVTFQPGETSQPVTIIVNGDVIDEGDETFFVNLSNAINAPIGDDQGMGIIINDDSPNPVTLSFQNGKNGYSGMRDTKLLSASPNTNYGAATPLEIDGDPDESSLLHWDMAVILPGSTVQSVNIAVNVTEDSGADYELYELKRSWVEGEATWNVYATGQSWQIAGADGSADRGSTVLGAVTGNSLGLNTISLNAAGVAVVQSWVDNPSSNHGFIIQDYLNHNNDLDFSSREWPTVAERPKLTVTFVPILSIVVNAKACLEGPWNNGTMHTTLSDNNLLPLNQPFNTSPWNYAGAETVGAIPPGVVDWVLIKLRTSPDASDEVAGRAAFIKSDGSIVDLDGSSPVGFTGIAAWDYYIVIYHRNHLALMSNGTQSLNGFSSLYDFTTTQNKAYGTDAMKELSPGVFGMVAGDGNSDGQVDDADKEQYWRLQNGTAWEYLKLADYNLDGGIDARDLNLYWRPNNGSNSQVPGAAASSFISEDKTPEQSW